MLPVQTYQFSAAADGREVVVDHDCIILGAMTSGAASSGAILSRDRATTIANAITAPSNTTDDNIIAVLKGPIYVPLQVEISVGQSVFVSISAAGSVVVYFQDINFS
jgi:hypothetical protein